MHKLGYEQIYTYFCQKCDSFPPLYVLNFFLAHNLYYYLLIFE